MKIRTRFILVLLAVSIPPAMAIVLLTGLSIKRLSLRISKDVEAKQQEKSIQAIEVLVDNYHEMIGLYRNAMQLTLKLQAREIEKRLSDTPSLNYVYSPQIPYGFDEKLPEHLKVNMVGEDPSRSLYPGNISHQYQNFFLAGSTQLADVTDDLARFESMTPAYHNLCELNRGNAVWHHTTLQSGLYTRYPGSDTITVPDGYDPRTRQWYLDAKNGTEGSATTINFDPATGRAVLTSAMPIYLPDGTFAGVTAIDLAMGKMVERFKLPKAIEDKSEMFITGLGMPGTEKKDDKLIVFLHDRSVYNSDWQEDVKLPELSSADSDTFLEMINDIKNGIAGKRFMEYEEKQSLWVYSGRVGKKAALTLIVPREVLAQLAEQTRAEIMDENLQQIRTAGLVILAIIALSIVVSIIRAHRFTKPIKQLAVVANKLAHGDYTASADVKTGDDHQELADVFNQVGPRLKQHQQPQHSLALAGAIQKNLLPKQPPKMSNFDVAGRCLYCDDTGGDYYDFVTFNDLNLLRIGLILGDVTGHGIGAALLMASARSIMRNLSADPNNDLPSIMRQFNDQLADDTHDDKFMTLFYGVLNDDDRSLVWSSGGHEPAIWFHKTENKFEELSNTGPLMGFMKEMEFPQASPVFLKSGDIVLIGTDGIWESQDTDEQFYGKQRLYDIIQKAADQPARGIVDAVIESVELFTAPIAPKDDVTMIVIRAL